MTTIYNTPRGQTYDPMTIEVWKPNGVGPSAIVQNIEKAEVTWSMSGAGTAIVEAPYSPELADLMNVRGSTLVIVRLNGRRHVSSIVEARRYGNAVNQHDQKLKIVTATPWSLLDGEIIRPVPDSPWSDQETASHFEMTGALETVIKTLIRYGAQEAQHPIYILPDKKRGKIVTVRTRLDSVGELVRNLLQTDPQFYLQLDAWIPGDEPIEGTSFSQPMVLADLQERQEKERIVWHAEGGDIGEWEIKNTAATATHIVTAAENDKASEVNVFHYNRPHMPWEVRYKKASTANGEVDIKYFPHELPDNAWKTEMNIKASPAISWEFGTDKQYPRQFKEGDVVRLMHEPTGNRLWEISDVVATLTPVSFSVGVNLRSV